MEVHPKEAGLLLGEGNVMLLLMLLTIAELKYIGFQTISYFDSCRVLLSDVGSADYVRRGKKQNPCLFPPQNAQNPSLYDAVLRSISVTRRAFFGERDGKC